MKINWKRKLSSRKFWAAVSGVVISVMIMFNATSESQEKVAGLIASTAVLSSYIFMEGSTDKAAIKQENETKE